MIALRVILNNKQLTIAGQKDLGVLTATIFARGKLGKSSMGAKHLKESIKLSLSVGGLTNCDNKKDDEHLRWVNENKLNVGDEIIVQITESDTVNEPTKRKKYDEDEIKRIRKEVSEKTEKKYG